MSNWNDDRLDKRDEEMKAGFAKVDERLAQTATRQEMNEGFARLEGQIKESAAAGEKRFARLEAQIVTLTGTLLVGALAIIAALIGIGS